jgi:hypothetical protein
MSKEKLSDVLYRLGVSRECVKEAAMLEARVERLESERALRRRPEKLRDESTEEGRRLWAAVGRAAERAPEWYKEARMSRENPGMTHSEECYKWHHECAVQRVERLEHTLREIQRALPDDPPEGYTFAEAVRAVQRRAEKAERERDYWRGGATEREERCGPPRRRRMEGEDHE